MAILNTDHHDGGGPGPQAVVQVAGGGNAPGGSPAFIPWWQAGGAGKAVPEFPGPVLAPAIPSPNRTGIGQTQSGPTGICLLVAVVVDLVGGYGSQLLTWCWWTVAEADPVGADIL